MRYRLALIATATLALTACLDETGTGNAEDAGIDVIISDGDTGTGADTGSTTTDTGVATDTGSTTTDTGSTTIDTGSTTTDTGTTSCGATLTCANTRMTDTGSTSGTTSGASAYALSCGETGGAPEHVVHFTSERAGTYTFSTAGSAFDTVLSVRDGDCGGAELACVDDVGEVRQAEVTLSLGACQTVAIIIDGYGDGAGAFQLTVTEAESACDDGIDNDGDGAADCDDADCTGAAGCDDWPAAWAQLEVEMLEVTNRHRAAGANCGGTDYPPVGPLEMNPYLRESARLHSKDMADNDYFDHDSQDGTDPFERMARAGFTGGGPMGENIAAGNSTAESILTQWMNSPGHCTNIMNGSYHVIGIGYAEGPGTYRSYSTQNFGGSH